MAFRARKVYGAFEKCQAPGNKVADTTSYLAGKGDLSSILSENC